MNEEFYIGWQAETPKGVAKKVKQVLILLAVVVPVFVVLTVVYQRHFSAGNFEGELVELEGIIDTAPFPMLKIPESGQSLLIVSSGKFGGEKILQKLKEKFGETPDDVEVKAKGRLIWYDGKALFELEDAELSYKKYPWREWMPVSLGKVTLRGEIADPKCLLGTMNPGEGIPHRDCAVRCIAGGITPVLKVANAEGEAAYYLLTGPDQTPINQTLLPYVGFGVQVCGEVKTYRDWLTLEVDTTQIKQIQLLSLNPGTMCQ